MLIDGRLLPRGGTLRRTVAVIGTGPAGITVAERLAARSIDTVVLEAGGRHHARPDDDALRGAGSGVPFPLVRSRRRGFGGTSGHWGEGTGLRIRPLDVIDFEARPGRPAVGWPFGRDELAPFYERAHESIGMASGYETSQWALDGSPTTIVWPGGPQLAMFRFAPHDEFTRRYDDLVASPHVDVALHAPVRRIVVSPDGTRVDSLDVAAPGGGRFSVVADVVVLAAGGIDNARVLLASPGPGGRAVGNTHDNVGRYFMDHLSIDTGVIEPSAGATIPVDVFLEHRARSDQHQAMLWLGDDLIRREGLLNAAFWVNDLDAAYVSPGISAARSLRAAMHNTPRRQVATQALRTLRGAPDIARYGLPRALRRPAARRQIGLRIMTEQLPNRDSRVTLTDQRDDLGMPRISLDWKLSTDDLALVGHHQALLAELLEHHRVGTVVDRFDPDRHRSPIMSNYHHMGATRMHVDDRQGVVDADCRVHGVGNLFVAGSSVFPTGGYLNPTLTIIALAIRIADTISHDLAPIAADSNVS